MTSNMEERFKSHNELGKKGWTLNFRPWELIYTEDFEIKIEALQREKQLKGAKGREWIRETKISPLLGSSLDSYPPKADIGSNPLLATKEEAITLIMG